MDCKYIKADTVLPYSSALPSILLDLPLTRKTEKTVYFSILQIF